MKVQECAFPLNNGKTITMEGFEPARLKGAAENYMKAHPEAKCVLSECEEGCRKDPCWMTIWGLK